MADVKISGLPASTTPLAGTEVLPIVQGTTTKQVSVANLTAGRAISATTIQSTVATGTAPLTVASTTEVANLRAANATSADTANQVKSNATTGVLQIAGPAAAATRVMTTPDANFTVARTDTGQTFTGTNIFGDTGFGGSPSYRVHAIQSVNGTATVGVTNSTAGTSSVARFIAISDAGNVAFGMTSSAYTDITNAQDAAIISAGNASGGLVIAFDGVRKAAIDTNGSFVPVSGAGIDFSANTHAAGMTSETLTWYEEGTWTPTDQSGAGLTFTNVKGTYTRIGRQVNCLAWLTYPSTANGLGLTIGGLPFNIKSTDDGAGVSMYCSAGFQLFLRPNSTTVFIAVKNDNSAISNANVSGALIAIHLTYFV
jgi:hypothetical protein